MSDWASGYTTEVNYVRSYHPHINPLRMRLALLNAGLAFPTIGTACELGFGWGLGPTFHASTSETQWHGTDVNPTQAKFAQDLAALTETNSVLRDDSFDEFAKRSDLPDFDYIVLHGIWSWISDQNRAVIVDFVRRKLKTGGVVYISYNTLPGRALFQPVQHLLAEHVSAPPGACRCGY